MPWLGLGILLVIAIAVLAARSLGFTRPDAARTGRIPAHGGSPANARCRGPALGGDGHGRTCGGANRGAGTTHAGTD